VWKIFCCVTKASSRRTSRAFVAGKRLTSFLECESLRSFDYAPTGASLRMTVVLLWVRYEGSELQVPRRTTQPLRGWVVARDDKERSVTSVRKCEWILGPLLAA
jgi:hypothetical protein